MDDELTKSEKARLDIFEPLFTVGALLSSIATFLLFLAAAVMHESATIKTTLFFGSGGSVLAVLAGYFGGTWMQKNNGPAFMVWFLVLLTFAPAICFAGFYFMR